MNEFLVSIGPAVGNHIWQSTVFAVAAGALAVLLKKNQAKTRYWIWLAASIKFLVPFSLLIGVGSMLPKLQHAPVVAQTAYSAMDMVSEPFAESVLPVTATYAPRNGRRAMPGVIASVWLCGLVVVVLMWWRQWRRVAVVARKATEADGGREMDILRRLERDAGMRPVRLLLSRSSLEPGVFGVVRPALVWPEGISARLSGGQMEAIVAHELCHVRRRDNLFAMAQMVVEAVFWFHPLVWWMGARMVEERERSCDEEVLGRGSDAEVYAESVLKICEFCLESPLACVSGITGADLKGRIVQIMSMHFGRGLGLGKKALLMALGLVAVAGPLAFGVVRMIPIYGQILDATGPLPSFDAATIKPPAPNAPGLAGFLGYPGGRVFFGGNIKALVEFAFNLQGYQVAGGPDWAASQWFEINAVPPEASPSRNIKVRNAEPTSEQRLMLQSLLRNRFGFKFHLETKEGEVYILSTGSKALQLKTPKDPAADPRAIVMNKGGIYDGEAEGRNTSTDYMAFMLGRYLKLPVLNQTEIAGSYDYYLPPIDPENHDQTTAVVSVVDRLGLKIKRGHGPIQTLVIDHVDQPSEN